MVAVLFQLCMHAEFTFARSFSAQCATPLKCIYRRRSNWHTALLNERRKHKIYVHICNICIVYTYEYTFTTSALWKTNSPICTLLCWPLASQTQLIFYWFHFCLWFLTYCHHALANVGLMMYIRFILCTRLYRVKVGRWVAGYLLAVFAHVVAVVSTLFSWHKSRNASARVDTCVVENGDGCHASVTFAQFSDPLLNHVVWLYTRYAACSHTQHAFPAPRS